MPSTLDYIDKQFRNILCSTRVHDIAPKWYSVIFGKTNETISSIFKKMIDHEIQSLPLYDEKSGKYVAFVDIFDILAYLVEVVGIPTDSRDELVMTSEFNNTMCSVLPDLSLRNPWNVVNKDESLQEVINIMSKTGIYRIAIVDSNGNLTSVLTQTRLIKFLSHKSKEMGPITKIPLNSLGFGNNPVIGIKRNEPTINAFLKIYQYNIGGVAVFNDESQIIGNISISDLKDIGFSLDMFDKMFITAEEFIERKIVGSGVPQLVWAQISDEIQDVFNKVYIHSIHRVFIIDFETKKPVGVISGSDIVCLFDSNHPPPVYLQEAHISEVRSHRGDAQLKEEESKIK